MRLQDKTIISLVFSLLVSFSKTLKENYKKLEVFIQTNGLIILLFIFLMDYLTEPNVQKSPQNNKNDKYNIGIDSEYINHQSCSCNETERHDLNQHQ